MPRQGTWEPYASPGSGSVVGDLRVWRGLESEALGGPRDLLALVPHAHATTPDRRFGVVYAWDAQNLFDEATSNAGEWRLDETMAVLALEGIEWLVVGLPHAGEERVAEYSPWRTTSGVDGRGDASLAFLLDVVKPLVDRSFRTLPGREATALLGSSLGGLMALYGLLRHPDVFSRAGVMSPAFATTGGRVFDWAEAQGGSDGRVWMDVGTAEWPAEPSLGRAYVEDVQRMRAVLEANGYGPDRLQVLVEEGGAHHESAWARRLPEALRFLLG